MAAVLAGARSIVGLDTGFTHLGAALGRPTMGIYCDHEPGLAGITGRRDRCSASAARARCPSRPTCWRCWTGSTGRRPCRGSDGRLLLFDAPRRVAVPAEAARALPEVVLRLEAAGRAAVALQRLGGTGHGVAQRLAKPRVVQRLGRAAQNFERGRQRGLLAAGRASSRRRAAAGSAGSSRASARSTSMPGSVRAASSSASRAAATRPLASAASAYSPATSAKAAGRQRRSSSQVASASALRSARARRWPASTSGRVAVGAAWRARCSAARRPRRWRPRSSAACASSQCSSARCGGPTSRCRRPRCARPPRWRGAQSRERSYSDQQRQPGFGRRRRCRPARGRLPRRGRRGRPS